MSLPDWLQWAKTSVLKVLASVDFPCWWRRRAHHCCDLLCLSIAFQEKNQEKWLFLKPGSCTSEVPNTPSWGTEGLTGRIHLHEWWSCPMKPTENRWSYLSNTAPQQPTQAPNIIIIFYHILQEKSTSDTPFARTKMAWNLCYLQALGRRQHHHFWTTVLHPLVPKTTNQPTNSCLQKELISTISNLSQLKPSWLKLDYMVDYTLIFLQIDSQCRWY